MYKSTVRNLLIVNGTHSDIVKTLRSNFHPVHDVDT